MRIRTTLTTFTLCLGMLGASINVAQALPGPTVVNSELALVIDSSGSIDASEFTLQMEGYQAAFLNANVQNNIASLSNGIAVSVFFFGSGTYGPNLETVLTSAQDSIDFGNAIVGLARPENGGTALGDGMKVGLDWLLGNIYDGDLIMDVSGDGVRNTGVQPSIQQARATLEGVTINGLAIDSGNFTGECLAGGYYTTNVITAGAACYQATGFGDFERAVIAKIQEETGGTVPAPATLALMGLGLLGFGFARRRKQS